jgi:recombinational DNA repair protein RecR
MQKVQIKHLILELQKEIYICPECFQYFTKGKQASPRCNICNSKNRDENVLMIVARDIDLENKYGDNALTLACRLGRRNFVELLI